MRKHAAGVLVLLACAALARADGIVVPARAVVAPVTTPGQRALIAFDGREETLVIETRFEGEGTEFAWIVPLPAPPVVEESTAGLFPTLHALTAPEVDDEIDLAALPIVVFAAGSAFALHRRERRRRLLLAAWAAAGVLAVALSVSMPRMQSSSHKGEGSGVTVLARGTTEHFETATLATANAGDLVQWLDANGFQAPKGIAEVADDYARAGHVFVASRVRADVAAAGRGTVHPLAFRFATPRAVYPMRLTGVTSPSCALELFVFGEGRASAPGLSVEHCAEVHDELTERAGDFHAELVRRAGGAHHLTKLAGTITGAGMHEDMTIAWSPFDRVQARFAGRRRAAYTALVIGAITASLVAAVAALRGSGSRLTPPIVGVVTSVAVYLLQPTLPAGASTMESGDDGPNRAWHEEPRPAFDGVAAARAWARAASAGAVNPYTGTPVREEDSPGNYVVREVAGKLELVTFDCHAGWGLVVENRLNVTSPELAAHSNLRSARLLPLAGRVVDADGAAVAGAEVFLDGASSSRSRRRFASGLRAGTAADGRFAFERVPDELCDLGAYKGLHAMALRAAFDPRAPGEVTLTLPRGATLAGRVVRADGSPLAGAEVCVQAEVPFLAPRPVSVVSGADGEFALPGLPAGDARIDVWVRVPRRAHDDHVQSFSVVAGDGPAELRLGAGVSDAPSGRARDGFVVARLGAAPPAPFARVSSCVRFRPGRDEFACGDAEGAVHLVDAGSGRVMSQIDGPGDDPWQIAFDAVGALASINRAGKSIVVASVHGDGSGTTYARHACFVGYARDRAVGFTGGHDGPWRVIDVVTGAETPLVEAASDLMAYDMGLSADGSRVFGFAASGELVAWDTASGAIVMRGPRRTARGYVRASNGGRRVALVGERIEILDTDAAPWTVIDVGPRPDGNLDFAVSPDRRWFALRVDERVELRSLDDGRLAAALSGFTAAHANDLAFSSDGRLLAAGTRSAGALCVWDVEAATR